MVASADPCRFVSYCSRRWRLLRRPGRTAGRARRSPGVFLGRPDRPGAAARTAERRLEGRGQDFRHGRRDRRDLPVDRPALDLSHASADRGVLLACVPYLLIRGPVGPITNEMAKKLSDEAAAIDDAEAKLKTASSSKIFAALPATKAADTSQIKTRSGRSFATSSPQTFHWSNDDQKCWGCRAGQPAPLPMTWSSLAGT